MFLEWWLLLLLGYGIFAIGYRWGWRKCREAYENHINYLIEQGALIDRRSGFNEYLDHKYDDEDDETL